MLKGYLAMHGLRLHALLKKPHFVEAQVKRSRRQRLCSEDLFFEADGPSPMDREIWLFDDVTTTGATFRAAVRALKSAGAKGVSTLAFAKSTLETSHTTAISAS
jgi:competence protein ComFC